MSELEGRREKRGGGLVGWVYLRSGFMNSEGGWIGVYTLSSRCFEAISFDSWMIGKVFMRLIDFWGAGFTTVPFVLNPL
jgi:hypothetical protein